MTVVTPAFVADFSDGGGQQVLAADERFQLADRALFDLADPLRGHAIAFRQIVQCGLFAILVQPTLLNDLATARVQLGQ